MKIISIIVVALFSVNLVIFGKTIKPKKENIFPTPKQFFIEGSKIFGL